MRFKNIVNNFFLSFIGIAILALLIWEHVSALYLQILAPITNAVASVINPAAQVHIIAGILQFEYTGITPQLLQFSVKDVDQIYLNSVVFFTLIVSSFRVPVRFRLKNYVIGQFLLSGVHVSLLIMYTYTNIWDFVGMQPEASQKLMQNGLEILFPSGITELFETIIYYWNTWEWDVLPLIFWLPIGLRQFSYLRGSQ